MSNFLNIGFEVNSEEDLHNLVEHILPKSKEYTSQHGTYFCYSDPSGADVWMQVNDAYHITGVYPHFCGNCRRQVRLASGIDRSDSAMDGAFHAWILQLEDSGSEATDTTAPFVFDVPDYAMYPTLTYPYTTNVQLAAFAGDVLCFRDEAHFELSQMSEFKWASKSLVPNGLLNNGEQRAQESAPAATCVFAGEVVTAERRQNTLSEKYFYALVIDTLGGKLHLVVADGVFEETPAPGNIVHGQCWLSGKLDIDYVADGSEEKKGFFSRLFG